MVHFRQRITLYIDGLRYARWTLNASEQTKGTGTNFGLSGDTGSRPAKRVYLYSLFIASAEAADVIPAFNPQVAATEMLYGTVLGASAADAAAATGTTILGWSSSPLKTLGRLALSADSELAFSGSCTSKPRQVRPASTPTSPLPMQAGDLPTPTAP